MLRPGAWCSLAGILQPLEDRMEPVIAIAAFAKVFQLGMQGWEALCAEGFDAKDLKAIQAIMDAGAGALKKKRGKQPPPDAATRQMALVLVSFGRAFERHWVGTRSLGSSRMSRFFDREEDTRQKDIENRLRLARLTPPSIGDRAPGASELAAVEALTGPPLATPYYRKLWWAFSDPKLVLDGEEPPLELDQDTARTFERHFLLAYGQVLHSPAGQSVLQGHAALEDYKQLVMRQVLVAGMSGWDRHHVFGNRPRSAEWDQQQMLPFLPLGEMYVEPYCRQAKEAHEREDGDARRVSTWLEEQRARPDKSAYVTVVSADFGMGKSLSARSLAHRLARGYLH